MLHHRQQLDMREAELLHVRGEPRRNFAIAERTVAVFRHAGPGAQVHLVDVNWLAHLIARCTSRHPRGIAPRVCALGNDDRCRLRRLLHLASHRIRFQPEQSFSRTQFEFVECVRRDPWNEKLPQAAAMQATHGILAPIPVAPVANDTHSLRIRCPEDE